jgi:hypothetical protein
VHPFLAGQSEPEGLQQLHLHAVLAEPPREASRERYIAVEDTADAYRVTPRYLCRVPVANDVKRCICGGVFSQRLDGANFCRRCGRD